MNTVLISRIFGLLIIGVTLPVFFLICSVSLMAFETTDPGMREWIFVAVVWSISVATPLVSAYYSWRSFGKKHIWTGFGITLIPALVLGGFWLWILQQSFS